MKMLRYLLICMAAALLLCAPALADSEVIALDAGSMIYQQGGKPQDVLISRGDTEAEAKQVVAAGMHSMSEEINIIDYRITVTDAAAFYARVLNINPDLFYVSGQFNAKVQTIDSVRYVYSVLPTYLYSAEQVDAMMVDYNAEISRAVSYASAASTPLLKALLVNDYFCLNYTYDKTQKIHDAYQMLTQKTGVCEAYMLCYYAVLDRLGIPVTTASSRNMNHAWNLINLDGSWYHVDVTWNDSTNCYHKYFLGSDANFEFSLNHYGWIVNNGAAASSTLYDEAPWRESDTAVAVRNNELYAYLSRGRSCVLARINGIEADELYSCEAKWVITDPDSQHYHGAYYINLGSLGICGDDLLFTTYDKAQSYCLTTGEVTTLYTAPEELGLWESSFSGNVLHYGLGLDRGKITERGSVTLDLHPMTADVLLPEDTLTIEAEAFAGTAVQHVTASSSLLYIECRAFAGCTALTAVELGDSVQFIADDAFDGCDEQLVIICSEGSYAARWADEHGIRVQYK